MTSHRLLVAAALLVPLSAAAQWTNAYTGNTFNNPVSSYMDTVILGKMRMDALKKQLGAKDEPADGEAEEGAGQLSEKPAAPAKPKFPITATDFKPGKKRLVPAVMANEAATPEERDQLRAVFEQILTAYESEKDLRKHNVAYGLAFLLAASAQVAYDREIADEDFQAMAREINDQFARSAEFKKLPAKDKQQLYEACVVTGGLVAAMHEAAKQQESEESAAAVKQLASSVLASFGLLEAEAGGEDEMEEEDE